MAQAAAAGPIIDSVGNALAKNPELSKSLGVGVEQLTASYGNVAETLATATGDNLPAVLSTVDALVKDGTEVGKAAAMVLIDDIIKNPGAYVGKSMKDMSDAALSMAENRLKAKEYKAEGIEIEAQTQGARGRITEGRLSRQEDRLKSQLTQLETAGKGAQQAGKVVPNFFKGLFGIRSKLEKKWQGLTNYQRNEWIQKYNELPVDTQSQYTSPMKYYGQLMGVSGASEENASETLEPSDFSMGGNEEESKISSALGGLDRLVPRLNLQFAKVMVLVLFLIAIAIWVSDKFRITIMNPDYARKAAIALGLVYLLLHTPIFTRTEKKLFMVF